MKNRTGIVEPLPPVVILAAGRGTRMGELTEKQQKTMLPLQGKPLLEITIERFVKEGFTNFVLVVGYRKEDIVTHFQHLLNTHKTYRNIHIRYVQQENIKGGTANAVSVCEKDVKELSSENGTFVLVYGDVVPSEDTVLTLKDNCVQGTPILTVKVVTDPERYGVIEVENEWVIGIHEKCENPPTNLINCGMYVLPRMIFHYISNTPISKRGEYELTTSIEMFIKEYPKTLRWRYINEDNLDVGTSNDYKEFKKRYEFEPRESERMQEIDDLSERMRNHQRELNFQKRRDEGIRRTMESWFDTH